jgi:hypothetical protein
MPNAPGRSAYHVRFDRARAGTHPDNVDHHDRIRRLGGRRPQIDPAGAQMSALLGAQLLLARELEAEGQGTGLRDVQA